MTSCLFSQIYGSFCARSLPSWAPFGSSLQKILVTPSAVNVFNAPPPKFAHCTWNSNAIFSFSVLTGTGQSLLPGGSRKAAYGEQLTDRIRKNDASFKSAEDNWYLMFQPEWERLTGNNRQRLEDGAAILNNHTLDKKIWFRKWRNHSRDLHI